MCKEKVTAKKVFGIIGMVIGGIALVLLLSFAVMWLWNALMPKIFGLGTITYWQGVGLAVLGRLLFGGMGCGGGDGDSKKKKHPVRHEIAKEMRKEMRKEFKKEMDKEIDADARFDEAYEDWWEKEGKPSFEKYAKDKTDSE